MAVYTLNGVPTILTNASEHRIIPAKSFIAPTKGAFTYPITISSTERIYMY